MGTRSVIVCLLLLFVVDARVHHVLSNYAPKTNAACPAGSLVRPAKGLSPNELAYVKGRRAKADAALTEWAHKIDPGFKTQRLPVVGLSCSGGGFRALLTAAGVIQAFDGRDGKGAVHGLYQALTYHSGLSGGGWLLSSLAGNDWPTISSLRDTLWKPQFSKGLIFETLNPGILYDVGSKASKRVQGSHSSLVDLYGRALSHMLFRGRRAGVDDTLSGVANKPSFQSHSVPYPIITAVEIDTPAGTCVAAPTSLQYEIHPYEFGSWDAKVRAFTPTKFLGTAISNGKPVKAGACTTNFDSLGYVLGTSSSLFNMVRAIACQEGRC